MDHNMTEGNPMRMILRFTIPLFLGNVLQQLYNMADSMIVGRFVGANALAGVGSTGTIMFLVNGIAIGLTAGFAVLTSQRYGAGSRDGTKRSVANGIILSAILAAILMVISLAVMHPILHMMNTPESIYREAYTYITIICGGLYATTYYNLFSAYLRAIGNSRIPLYFLIFSAALNVVLDLTFILVLGWGVAGAARATILSQGISALLCLIYIMKKVDVLRPGREHWRLHPEDSRQQLAIGIPMALQYGITASGTMIMQAAINIYEAAIAAFTAASRIQSVMMQGFISLGLTMASYAGQNYGAGRPDRIRQGVRDAMKLVVAYAIIGGAGVALALPRLMHLFFSSSTDIGTVLPWARIYLYECITCYIPLGAIFVFRNTLQGCGRGMAAMTMGIVELAARAGTAMLSMALGSYMLAVGCDPAAWLAGGIYGAVLYVINMKKIESSA